MYPPKDHDDKYGLTPVIDHPGEYCPHGVRVSRIRCLNCGFVTLQMQGWLATDWTEGVENSCVHGENKRYICYRCDELHMNEGFFANLFETVNDWVTSLFSPPVTGPNDGF